MSVGEIVRSRPSLQDTQEVPRSSSTTKKVMSLILLVLVALVYLASISKYRESECSNWNMRMREQRNAVAGRGVKCADCLPSSQMMVAPESYAVALPRFLNPEFVHANGRCFKSGAVCDEYDELTADLHALERARPPRCTSDFLRPST